MTSPGIPKTEPRYRAAEVYLFETCTMKCGYCWLAERGIPELAIVGSLNMSVPVSPNRNSSAGQASVA